MKDDTNEVLNTQPLMGLNLNQNLLVQKSVPMLSLWRSSLSLAEFKILDGYLARIDSHHPEYRWVRFRKDEIEALLGVKSIKMTELRAHMKRLYTLIVDVQDITESKCGEFVLFEASSYDRDDDGTWYVNLKCTEIAMKYVFNVDNIGYLKYRLKAIINLRSRYSYLLYLYLEQNSYRGTWEVNLSTLHDVLGCHEPSYQAFRRFNDRVLKPAQKELKEKIGYEFKYTPKKKGNRVISVVFTCDSRLSEFSSRPIDSTAYPLALDAPAESAESDLDKVLSSKEILASVFWDSHKVPEFSPAEISHILAALNQVPINKLPLPNSTDILHRWFLYLSERYAAMNRISETKFIKNRFAYFFSMIKQDWE